MTFQTKMFIFTLFLSKKETISSFFRKNCIKYRIFAKNTWSTRNSCIRDDISQILTSSILIFRD